MNWANAMLAKGTESHACARYVAWPNATTDTSPDADGPQGTDGNGVYWEFFDPRQFLNPPQNQKGSEADYSLRFVDCNSVQGWNAQDDLTSPAPSATPASSGDS